MRWPLTLLLLTLAGCGDTLVLRGGVEVPSSAAQYAGNTDPGDPLERLNRRMLDVNTVADESVFRPVAETYVAVVPAFGRLRIRQFLENLGEPVVFANNVLQLRLGDAAITAGRFVVNSTLGGAGLFDVATAQGLPRQTGDFGQTLARYGIGEGPFLMLPVLGPSNVRDVVGDVVDGFGNPLLLALGPAFSSYTLGVLNATRGVLGGVDLRAENLDTLDALRADSIDFYARLRSVARQRRAFGAMAAVGRTVPDPLDDPGTASTVPAAGGAGVPLVLDDPGTGSAPVRAATPGTAPNTAPRAAPVARRPQVPPEWARDALNRAALQAPVASEELPRVAPADPGWAAGTLGAARLR
ncbi:MAG: VacJ family lipoprotein [Rubritepida sp.]|nr:VacJ family lipoprotein [Rubritepida sp.]